MKSIRFAPALVLLLLCSACVPLASFFPLWDKDHVTIVPGLQGTWIEPDGGKLELASSEDGRYAATFTSDDSPSQYEVHAVALGGRYFLDFIPDDKAMERVFKGTSYFSLVTAHFFARISVNGDSLHLSLLDDDKVAERAQRGDLFVPLLKRDGQYLLTADTPALQRLMGQFADDPTVWEEPLEFARKK